MSIRLGMDASQTVASCAVSVDGTIAASGTIERPIENFTELIRRVTADAAISLDAVDEIVVCIGPGSQTGIRTAVVIANALALALHKPVSGVRSTDAAAVLLRAEGCSRVAVTAGRRRWFVSGYQTVDGRLERDGEMELLEEIPEDARAVFGTDGRTEQETCACGILLVAEQERHLMEQSMTEQVLPYEG